MGLSEQQKEIISYGVNILKPKPKLTGSQWADKYFYLSAESSSAPGKWHTRPWQKEIIDAMTDNTTKICVFKKPTRVGYTKMLNIAAAFYIHQHPSVQLHYQPNADEAKGYAEDEFEPMVRDNRVISKLIETPNIRGRAKKEKTIKKLYPGGYAEFLGAESDRNFNRRTARVVSADELDTWKKEVGKAGDVVATMMRRTSDFWDRKNILGGKPIGGEFTDDMDENEMEGISLIDYWFKKGSQEYRHLPCPYCKFYQRFDFADLTWNKDKDTQGNTIAHHPETAHFVCKKCGERIYDQHKRDMDKKGKWIAENPQALKEGIRSFHIWAMLSYSPNVTWADIAREFLAAKADRLKFKAFTNEVLALTWEDEYEKVNIGDWEERKEAYTSQIPEGVYVLTAGADTQDDRIECEVIGWGEAEESWSIEYKIFYGDTSKPDVWQRFDEFLLKTYTHESGGLMRVYCCGLDTQGHRAKEAYSFCKARFHRRVLAFKGSSTVDAPIAPRLASRNNKGKVPLFLIGVNQAKDVIYSHIMTDTPGPGYMHFPQEDEYSAEYFKQLTAEKRAKNGKWVKTRARNEAIDVRVYGYASLFIVGVDLELLVANNKPIMHVQTIKTQKKRKKRDYLEEY